MFNQMISEFHTAQSMNKLPDIVPTSAGGYNSKTSKIYLGIRLEIMSSHCDRLGD